MISSPDSLQWDFQVPSNTTLIDTSALSAYEYFFLYLFYVWSFFWLFGIIIFLFRIKDTNIQMRSPYLAILSAVGAELCLLCTTYDLGTKHQKYPCFLDLWYILSFFPLYCIPFILRFARYFYRMSRLKAYDEGKISSLKPGIFDGELFWIGILLFLVSITMGCGVGIQFLEIKDWICSYGCALKSITKYVLWAIFGIIVFLVICGLVLMRRFPDPYHIKSELVSCFVVWMITLPFYIYFYQSNSTIDPLMVMLMYIFIFVGYFTSIFWPIYLSFKHPPEDTAPEAILETIEDIIQDEEGYKLVMQVAANKRILEVPPFFKEVLGFRNISDPRQMKTVAADIYNEFIRDKAPRQNNFAALMVEEVRSRLENPSSDMFNACYREDLKLMKTNFLTEIKNLPAYAQLYQQREKERQNERNKKALMERN